MGSPEAWMGQRKESVDWKVEITEIIQPEKLEIGSGKE